MIITALIVMLVWLMVAIIYRGRLTWWTLFQIFVILSCFAAIGRVVAYMIGG